MKGNNYFTPLLMANNDMMLVLTAEGRDYLKRQENNPQHDELSIWIDLTEGSDLQVLMPEHVGSTETDILILAYDVNWEDNEIVESHRTRFWSHPVTNAITALLSERVLIVTSSTKPEKIRAGLVRELIPDAIHLVTEIIPTITYDNFADALGKAEGDRLWATFRHNGFISAWQYMKPHQRTLFCNLITNTKEAI